MFVISIYDKDSQQDIQLTVGKDFFRDSETVSEKVVDMFFEAFGTSVDDQAKRNGVSAY